MRGRQPQGVPEAVIADLARRVSELEQQIGQTQSAEQLTPTYLTVTAGGQVSANFSGIVNALGLTLPAAQTGAEQPANSIEWTTSNGTVAQIFGSSANPPFISHPRLTLRVIGAGAQLYAQANNGTPLLILDDLGESDFVLSNSVSITATAGAANLPTNPLGFLNTTTSGGVPIKIPYYSP